MACSSSIVSPQVLAHLLKRMEKPPRSANPTSRFLGNLFSKAYLQVRLKIRTSLVVALKIGSSTRLYPGYSLLQVSQRVGSERSASGCDDNVLTGNFNRLCKIFQDFKIAMTGELSTLGVWVHREIILAVPLLNWTLRFVNSTLSASWDLLADISKYSSREHRLSFPPQAPISQAMFSGEFWVHRPNFDFLSFRSRSYRWLRKPGKGDGWCLHELACSTFPSDFFPRPELSQIDNKLKRKSNKKFSWAIVIIFRFLQIPSATGSLRSIFFIALQGMLLSSDNDFRVAFNGIPPF